MSVPHTVDEWALSLPEEDRKRLTAILVYTPFARHFLKEAWSMGYRQAESKHRVVADEDSAEGDMQPYTIPPWEGRS